MVEPSSRACAPTGQIVLSAERVSKSFAGVKALNNVDFDLRCGEVHALMGENGAGKSTLMKILAGVHTSYQGTIQVDGRAAEFAGVRDAEEAGVAIIHQELNLVPELSIADNIFLGREPLIGGVLINRRRMVKAAERLLRRLGVWIAPESRLADLRVGEQQLVEIAKALSLDARILIMDEPTSALSSSECETLFKIVRQLASEGVAIIYTSHRIEEVLDLADRVTVLRDGRRVVTAPIGDLSRDAIISAMVGRDMVASDRGAAAQDGAIVLSVDDLTLDTLGPHGWRRMLHGVSFQLRRGEILGIGGLLGSGRTEILESIFGVANGWRGGAIAIDGAAVNISSPAEAYRLGVALVSEDRKERGLHLAASICDNIALPSIGALSRFGLRAFALERALAADMARRLSVRCTGIDQTAAALSGGNQQKVVIGKWLATEPRILLLDEPTRGIDIGAKQDIYRLIFDLAAQGLGIVVVTSEMPELILLSDRILVMCEGRQTGVLRRESATQETVMRLAAPGMAAWSQETSS
ncbi:MULTISPECIES: sugar ABC transporter ATP-binding protein [unclassified Bradyrhizobium]|uniref:sugar ABC transporter ATP-binding protein n=1 Tax=unclassified Bradyrhizobium TaxID=2631580 RepID=UPI001FF76E7E|nr:MULTISPECIES: sugar ABC transporter ATP-binding protein [unclassified Bradyrhizobium]MCK1708245.1 sugar ABC transporter ATP-binding protein [Bradyrhizobium sp. 143]MCK1730166.1 sugar ABC transporter ATP-binding protein [Bradyrhizobium sp. 142]